MTTYQFVPNMASQVYLYLSAVTPPTILLTGPGIPHVLSVGTRGVSLLSQVCNQMISMTNFLFVLYKETWNCSPFLEDLPSMIAEEEFDAARIRLLLGQQVIWHWNPL